MATNPAVPYWDEGNTFTGHASAAVTGKRFVGISGPRTEGNPTVAHAAAASRAIGVAGYDAAADAKVTVYAAPGIVMPVEAGGAISAGDEVEVGANGTAVTQAAGVVVGTALDDAAQGDDVPVKLA